MQVRQTIVYKENLEIFSLKQLQRFTAARGRACVKPSVSRTRCSVPEMSVVVDNQDSWLALVHLRFIFYFVEHNLLRPSFYDLKERLDLDCNGIATDDPSLYQNPVASRSVQLRFMAFQRVYTFFLLPACIRLRVPLTCACILYCPPSSSHVYCYILSRSLCRSVRCWAGPASR